MAVSAVALAMAPAVLPATGPLAGTAAFAAGNGHGGGNGGGNGGGHGHGGDHGNAGGNGIGHSGVAHGKSGGHGHSGGAKGFGGFLGGLFGVGHGKSGQAHGHGVASRDARSLAHRQQAALHNKDVPVPTEVPSARNRNIHAKLGWLNSLQRNYMAYLNAKDPKFAPIQDYVLGQAQARTDLATALDAYSALGAYYDDAPVDTTDPEAVNGRIDALTALTDRTAEQQAELDALTSVATADAAVDDLSDPTNRAGLVDALEAATNSTTVDPDVVDWSADVLSGKIGDVQAALGPHAADTSDPTETEVTTTSSTTP